MAEPVQVDLIPPSEPSVEDVWAALIVHVAPKKVRLTANRRSTIKARIRKYGAHTLIALGKWLATSQHHRAVYLRQRGDITTAIRKEKMPEYIDLMGDEQMAPPDPDSPAGFDYAAEIRRLVSVLGAEGVSRLGGMGVPTLRLKIHSAALSRLYGQGADSQRKGARIGWRKVALMSDWDWNRTHGESERYQSACTDLARVVGVA